MASFEQAYYLHNPGKWQVLRRNTRLLWALLLAAIVWCTQGLLLRRAIKRAQSNNTEVVLDDWFSSQE